MKSWRKQNICKFIYERIYANILKVSNVLDSAPHLHLTKKRKEKKAEIVIGQLGWAESRVLGTNWSYQHGGADFCFSCFLNWKLKTVCRGMKTGRCKGRGSKKRSTIWEFYTVVWKIREELLCKKSSQLFWFWTNYVGPETCLFI